MSAILAQISRAEEMPEGAQRIHMPFSPLSRFAILGLSVFFISAFSLSFRNGSKVGKGGMGSLTSIQGNNGVAPLRRLPEPPWMDRGIYQLEDGSYPNVSRFQRAPFGKWKLGFAYSRLRFDNPIPPM
eukprot:s849_g22.t1